MFSIVATLKTVTKEVPRGTGGESQAARSKALAYFRGSRWDSVGFQEMGRQMAAYDAQRRRGAPGYGRMINNVDDMLDYEDGTVDGVRYTLANRLSRSEERGD